MAAPRALYYVPCTNCNSRHGPYSDTPEGAKEEAKELGWAIDVLVPNGSLWDFCPSCWKKVGKKI
jgi:hypothetical protein